MLDEATLQRLFTVSDAFADPLVRLLGYLVGGLLAFAFAAIVVLRAARVTDTDRHKQLLARTISWTWLSAFIVGPVFLGRAAVIAAVLVLSMLCYRDFARATGVFRIRPLSAVVALGMLLLAAAAVDQWHRLYFAATPLVIVILTIITLPADKPSGYLQRTGLSAFGFLLFGTCLGYVSLLTEVPRYRATILFVVLAVTLSDVLAFTIGSITRGPKLLPQTSPGKTIGGSVASLVLTTVFVTALGRSLFQGTRLGDWEWLVVLGVAVSSLAQLGDLVLSSIKRDIGIQHYAQAIPGHGGVLDRFDSLVLVPPIVYHGVSLLCREAA
jgi:phosphatidate cytidylyltransferase